ncbi:MAG: GAF domain-containing protein, partial [Oleiphilaceae bacterium]|nr:GAF domain-containing protein [Oleiphilaceae bacterium]
MLKQRRDAIQRIQLQRELGLLESAPEERFDRLTRLASIMFDLPIALVSLIDKDRHWFKSRVGLDVTSMHHDISFCQHTITQHGLMEVPDSHVDQRFCHSPLVTGDINIRYYAGHPLIVEGITVGTLCLADHKPNKLSDKNAKLVCKLAEWATREIILPQLDTLDARTMFSNQRGLYEISKLLLRCDKSASQGICLGSIQLQYAPKANASEKLRLLSYLTKNLQEALGCF